MGRMRKRKSEFEKLVELASMKPWWLCFSLALIAYVFLHSVAERAPATPTSLSEFSDNTAAQFVHVFASIGQYVIPIILVLAGLGSLFRRVKSRRLRDSFVESGGNTKDLAWQEFEQLVGELFRAKGYSVAETAKGADGGIDLILRRDNERYLVQCKHWKARQVGVKVIRELKGVISAQGATGGGVATSGNFTAEAVQFATTAGIDLIDGSALGALAGFSPVEPATPACPKCGSGMTKRTARRGANAGSKFWGCQRFPTRRGTLAIDSSQFYT